MTSSPPSSPAATWIVDRDRDFLSFVLIALAEAALDHVFTIENAEEAYLRWITSTQRKPKSRTKNAVTAPKDYDIRTWNRPSGYAISLRGLPTLNSFVVLIDEEHFTARINVVYDIDSAQMESGNIEQFTGDHAAARVIGTQFRRMLNEVAADHHDGPADGADLDALAHRLATGASLGGPLTGKSLASVRSSELDMQIAEIAGRLALSGSGHSGGSLQLKDEHFLAATPEALWAIRDGFVIRASAGGGSENKTLPAWQTLLEHQLEELRFKAERHHDWAIAMLDRYQTDLLAMVHRPDVGINTWQALVIALDRAKIDIRPEVRAASLDLAAGVAGTNSGNIDIMRSMEEIVESGGGDPFRIAGHLFDAITMMPPDFANAAVSMVSGAPLPALRDVLPLVLLAPEGSCRQAAAAALEQMAAEKRLTPAGLRRLIAVRSWLPESERRSIDHAIRRARLAGVDCAPWPQQGQVRAIQASVIDGSGCQSLLALAKDGSRHMFTGILIKQGFGVRDVMVERGLPRREGDAMLSGVASQVLVRPVERAYLDRVVQHALSTGLEAGHMPPLALLEIAEVLGATEWRAQPLNPAREVNHLLDTAPSEFTTPAAQAAALKRSATWTSNDNLAGSWFEDDQEARSICARLGRTPKKALTALLDEVIEPRRTVWAERLVLMALWAKAGGTDASLPTWIDYTLIARSLYDGTPMARIPLMSAIAKLTITRFS